MTSYFSGYVTNGPVMTSRRFVTLRLYICRHQAPRMREIFGHVTAVISRIAHACVATWRRVMLHGSLVPQSTDHSSSSSSSTADSRTDRDLQPTSVFVRLQCCVLLTPQSREYRPILYVPAQRVISHIALSNYRITYCNASSIDVCKSVL